MSRRRAPAQWWALHGPVAAVCMWAAGRLAFHLSPRSTAAWPGRPTEEPDRLAAWWHGLRWPDAGTVVGNVLVVAAVVVGVVVADRWPARWRQERMLRWQWARSTSLDQPPRLRRARLHGGVVDARVSLRRHGSWHALETALDPDKGTMLRQLWLGRHLGTPVRATLSTAECRNPAKTRRLRLHYLPLPHASQVPAWEQPANDARVVVGVSVDGPVVVDLDQVPHIRLVGSSGTGKGFCIRLLETQALLAGWLVLLIDGGVSPEHALIDPAPTALRPMRSQATVQQRLEAAVVAVRAVKAMADARSAIAEAFGATRWVEIPEEVRAWLPRVAVIIDETTAMLAESKDKSLDNLRAQLRTALDTDVLRNGRKFGVHVLPLSDQFAYSGVFSKGAQQQAERFIVLGNLASEHVRQVTGLSSLPPVPDEPRCGHVGRFGNPNPIEIRVPSNDPASLRRAVAVVAERCAA